MVKLEKWCLEQMKVRLPKNPSELIVWSPKLSDFPMKTSGACRSKIQFSIGEIIKKRYPMDPILEDVTLPFSRLSLDFFLPQRLVAIEVQGQQHDQRNYFFHKKLTDFLNQKDRDNYKQEFCDLNGIMLHKFRTITEAENVFKC